MNVSLITKSDPSYSKFCASEKSDSLGEPGLFLGVLNQVVSIVAAGFLLFHFFNWLAG